MLTGIILHFAVPGLSGEPAPARRVRCGVINGLAFHVLIPRRHPVPEAEISARLTEKMQTCGAGLPLDATYIVSRE